MLLLPVENGIILFSESCVPLRLTNEANQQSAILFSRHSLRAKFIKKSFLQDGKKLECFGNSFA